MKKALQQAIHVAPDNFWTKSGKISARKKAMEHVMLLPSCHKRQWTYQPNVGIYTPENYHDMGKSP